jgi:hypothetical protein
MLVFSSALRRSSLGPSGSPCQVPAYQSSIGPAFAAKRGARGKIQYLSRQGLIASVASIRHTVLRLIGCPSACWARAVTSVSDCRLRGCWVSATSSQATALTSAWSRGRKTGVTPPSRLIVQAEVPLGPSLPPVADRIGVQTHPRGRLHMRQEWLRVQQEHQAGALAKLVLDRTPSDELLALDHKGGGEIGAVRWERSRHEGHPFQRVIFVAQFIAVCRKPK